MYEKCNARPSPLPEGTEAPSRLQTLAVGISAPSLDASGPNAAVSTVVHGVNPLKSRELIQIYES